MASAGTVPGRRRTKDPDAVKRRVLDAAAIAFQARGYHATSTHDLMRLARVTGGALHHHFPSKKSLGLAVIRERVAKAVETTWLEPVRTAPSAAEGILAAFESIAAELDRRGHVAGCPLNNLALELAAADPEFRFALREIYDAWQAEIAERLAAEDGVATGPPRDVAALATLVVAAYSGAMAIAKTSQESAPLKTCAQQLAEVLKASC